MEEEQLARQLGVPIEEIPAMLKDDRVDSTLGDETDGVDSAGTLYKMVRRRERMAPTRTLRFAARPSRGF
jgi:hypothetical protein